MQENNFFKIDMSIAPVTENELREILNVLRKIKADSGWGRIVLVVEKGRVKSIEYSQSKLLAPDNSLPGR